MVHFHLFIVFIWNPNSHQLHLLLREYFEVDSPGLMAFVLMINHSHGEVRFHILATSNPKLLEDEKMVSRRSKLTRRVFGEELQGLLECELHLRFVSRLHYWSFYFNSKTSVLEALSSSDDGNTLSFNDTRLYPIEFNRDINLFNSTVLCGTQNINGGINLDVNPKLTGNVSMHFVAVGTLDPLHLEDFGISSCKNSIVIVQYWLSWLTL